MRLVLVLFFIGILLGGCSQREIRFVDYVGDVATATANGFATGGPVGAVVGLLTGIMANRGKRKQVERREAIVQAYRRKAGDLTPEEYEIATGKPPRRPKKKPGAPPCS